MSYDSINPSHYHGERRFEPIEVIEDWDLNYRLGNALKYISRNGRKPGEDQAEGLSKAIWYLQREIEALKGKNIPYSITYEDVLEEFAACDADGAVPIEIIIRMPLFSKARPRVTSRGTFMPKEYQAKQKEMLRQIQDQYKANPLTGPIRLEVDVFGEGRADADNIIGAFMDTANKILWVDDRVAVIPELQVRWKKAPKTDSRWVIRIYPLDCEQETLF